MHDLIKSTLLQLTIKDLQSISEKNDLRISNHDLVTLHYLLAQHWHEIIDDASLSLKEDSLINRFDSVTISKYKELITAIKRTIIFNSIF